MSRRWVYYVDDILEAVQKIEKFIDGMDKHSFELNLLVVDAVLFNIQMIGEAIKNLPKDVRELVPGVNWVGLARMRDIIAHHYFALDIDVVWETATVHVPELKSPMEQLQHLLETQGLSHTE